jgi:hypothetical protein
MMERLIFTTNKRIIFFGIQRHECLDRKRMSLQAQVQHIRPSLARKIVLAMVSNIGELFPACVHDTNLYFLVGYKTDFCVFDIVYVGRYDEGPLRLHEKSSHWKVATCCTEAIMRRAAVKLGKPTPFDQEMNLSETIPRMGA